ncbi:YadA C-terminal domain-containing protein [Paralysiella testudinis]|nr:YadA C-terminal domain-containing protein [Paralysiella testudinis]
MANIPAPPIMGTTTIGAGLGHYDNQSALAIGATHYFLNGVSIKGSVSTGFTGESNSYGAGISYTW